MLPVDLTLPKPSHAKSPKSKNGYTLRFDLHRNPLWNAAEWAIGKFILNSRSGNYSNDSFG